MFDANDISVRNEVCYIRLYVALAPTRIEIN